MISELVTILQHIDPELRVEDVADAIWLALYMETPARKSDAETITLSASNVLPSERDDNTDSGKLPQPPVSQVATSGLHLSLQQENRRDNKQWNALPFRSPAALALPGSLDIARALRPFMRRVPHLTTFVLNEEATAERIAEVDVWIPVLDHALTRWLDVALVIDRGASMSIWRQTIAEFYLLLTRQGAFRDVRIWELDTNVADKVRLYVGKSEDVRRQARSERELIDTSGRRLILVLTDCVSPAWHSGQVAEVLVKWGQYNAVTLVQVLPQPLWSRTALGMATAVRLQASAPGIANTQLNVQPTYLWNDEDEMAQSGLLVPIVTLEPEPLAAWSRVIARAEDRWIPGYKLATTVESNGHNRNGVQEETSTISFSAAERIQLFRANASSTARRLAGLLAIVPISMPIVRLIQRTMLPESRQVHVAEVFLSGLLEVISVNSDTLDPDYIEYEFADGVREALLNPVPISDKARVLSEISDFIESKYDQVLDFRTLIANPGARGGVSIGKESKPFASMAAKVLRRFGGEYVSLADWLEENSKDEVDPLPPDEPALPSSNLPDKLEDTVLSTPTSSPSQIPSDDTPIASDSSATDPHAFPQDAQIIKEIYSKSSPYVKCKCPSCFEEIYLGECEIVSGITGQVIKAPAKGLLARMRVEPLTGRKYTLELARRKCTNCGYHLPENIELVPSITLAVVGDVASGKSHYIAALIHQIMTEWLGNTTGYARFRCLTPEVEQEYARDYFGPLFSQKRAISPTQPATKQTAKPLVYELIISSSPQHPPTATNLMFYDASGEDYSAVRLGYARFVLNASAFIFVANPVSMAPIFRQLPHPLQANLQSEFNMARRQNTADGLNEVIAQYERYHAYPDGSRLPNIPIAVMASKADLLDYLNPPRPYSFMRNPHYVGGVDLRDLNAVDQEVRGLLRAYQQNDLLAATSRFELVKYFATSATGEPPDTAGQFQDVKPRRCLDPMLWILHKLGIVRTSV